MSDKHEEDCLCLDCATERSLREAEQAEAHSLHRMVLTRPAVQRLEAWMKEITDLLCYQPEVPLAHKTEVVNAMVAFSKEIEAADSKRQNSYSNDSKP